MVSRFVQHNNDLKQQHSNTSSQNKPDFGKTDQDHILDLLQLRCFLHIHSHNAEFLGSGMYQPRAPKWDRLKTES